MNTWHACEYLINKENTMSNFANYTNMFMQHNELVLQTKLEFCEY